MRKIRRVILLASHAGKEKPHMMKRDPALSTMLNGTSRQKAAKAAQTNQISSIHPGAQNAMAKAFLMMFFRLLR